MRPSDLFPSPKTDPASIYRLRDALYVPDLLTAALVHLDLFSRLAERPASLDEITGSLGLALRPADVMLTCFTGMGLLDRKEDVFRLTDLAGEHLVKGSPWFLGPYYASFKDRPVCLELLQVLKTGKPANWGSGKGEKDWAKSMEDETFADQFSAAMDCRGAFLGPALARALDLKQSAKLLDVAGGSGIYACALAARNPHLRATVLEKPPVDKVAEEWIAKRGLADRVAVIARDMFASPLPGGHDVHLFSNAIHDWDVAEVKALLLKSRQALLPGGKIAIHDAHLNREKTGPLEVAEYSVLLMHATEGRCYSLGEMESYLAEAGFGDAKHVPTVAGRSVITAKT